ncbi:hypothetical protein QQ045_002036 [Rhodiola kirilowii]
MNGYNTWTSHGERSNKLSLYTLRQQWLAERHGESSSSGAMHHQTNPTIEMIEDEFPFRHLQQEDHNMNMNPLDSDLGSRMAHESYNNLIVEAQTPLYRDCEKYVLETILRAMPMKVESRLSDKGFNKMLQITKEIFPRDNIYPGSYKDVKKVLKNMGLGYETIHACEHGCILYYKEFQDLFASP